MKWNVMLGSLVLATGLCSHGYSFGLLDRMLGVSGCCSSSCCDSGCGAAVAGCCEAPAPVAACCEAPVADCCAAEPACGCAPSGCGCHGGGLLASLHNGAHRALHGLMAPLNGCGCNTSACCEPVCAVEPSCGYAAGCGGCHGHGGGLLNRLFCNHGHSGCGCEATCGAPVGCATCGAAPSAGQPMPAVEDAPPAPVVDPSASVRRSARVMKASLTR